jgi:UDP-N-acetylglucosamine acyltransferase
MAYVHIAHDCIVGNRVIMANAATLAGHVVVEDRAGISGLSAVHHFVTIGTHSYIGGCSKINQDVPPYCLVDGNPSRLRGLNLEGLKRSGIDRRAISALKEAFRLLYRSNLNLTQAVEELASKPLFDSFTEVRHLVEFVKREVSGWRGRGREASRPDRPKVGFNLEDEDQQEERGREGASG